MDKNGLRDHFRVKHSNEKPYKCKECNKGFGRSDYLQGHMYSNHGLEKPCDKCDKCDYRSGVLDQERSVFGIGEENSKKGKALMKMKRRVGSMSEF